MKPKRIQLTDANAAAIRLAESRFESLEIRAVVRNLFALGLYLRLIGRRNEGYKACMLALRALRLGNTRNRRILRLLKEDGDSLAIYFKPHSEIMSLIERCLDQRSR